MNILELKNEYGQATINNDTKILELWLGKAKKPFKVLKFNDFDKAKKYCEEKLENYKNIKYSIKNERKLALEKRKKDQKFLMENLKVGQFLKSAYGSTLRRVQYYVVEKIEGKKVFLSFALIKREGYGNVELVGKGKGSVTQEAHIHLGKIRKMDKYLNKPSMHGWDVCSSVEIGDTDCEFDD